MGKEKYLFLLFSSFLAGFRSPTSHRILLANWVQDPSFIHKLVGSRRSIATSGTSSGMAKNHYLGLAEKVFWWG